MPTISLTDPVAHTNADAGVIATNNGNLRTLLNSGIDAANLKGNPALVSGEVPVWNGTQWDRSSVTRIGVTSLGSGTPDATKVLAGDGTWQPGVVRLYDSILSVDTANFDITPISGAFSFLKLVLYARGDTAAVTTTVLLRFNNDSTGNYDDQFVAGVAAATSAAEAFGNTSAILGAVPANTAGANLFGHVEVQVPHYAGSVNNKTLISLNAYKTGTATGNLAASQRAGFWRSNAAITRITILPGAGNFKAGSRLTLYGMA